MNVKELCKLSTVITVYGGVIDYLFGLQTIYSIFSAGEHTFHYFLGKFFMDRMIRWGPGDMQVKNHLSIYWIFLSFTVLLHYEFSLDWLYSFNKYLLNIYCMSGTVLVHGKGQEFTNLCVMWEIVINANKEDRKCPVLFYAEKLWKSSLITL